VHENLAVAGRKPRGGVPMLLMSNPRVLLMDEPSEGLAPLSVAEVMATMVLNSGRVVVAGSTAEPWCTRSAC